MQKKRCVVKQFERSNAFYLKYGEIKRQQGRLDDAMVYFSKAEANEPTWETYLAVASALWEAERYFDAISYLYGVFPVAETRPAEMYLYLATNYSALGETMQARIALAQYLSMDDGDEYVRLLSMFTDLIRANDLQTIIPKCEKISERKLESLFARCRHPLCYGEYEQAIVQYTHFAELYPDNQEVIAELAYLNLLVNKIDKAFEYVELLDLNAIEVDIDVMCLYVILKGFLGQKENVKEELERLREIDARRIGDANTLSRLASTYMMFEQYEDALPFAKQLHMLMPYVTETNHKYAVCCFATGDYKTAFNCYHTILRFAPDDFIAANFQKRCRIAMREKEQGIEQTKQAFLPNFYFVDTNTMIDMIKNVNEIMKLDMHKAIARFDDLDDPMYNLFLDVLCYCEETQKQILLEYLCKFPTDTLITFLRSYLTSDEEDSYQAKNMALIRLMKIAPPPYSVAFGSKIIEGYPNGDPSLDEDISESFAKIRNNCLTTTRKHYKALASLAASELLTYYLNADYDIPEIEDEKLMLAIAATITYRACARCGLAITPEDVCGHYGITMTDLETGVEYLSNRESMYIE